MSRSPRISASGIKSGASKVLKFSIVLPMFLTIMFPLIYGFSMHSPQPHGMKIAIVGSDAQTQHLATKLDAQAGDAYDVTAVGSVDDAKHAIKSLDIRAAWDPKTNTEYVATMGSTSAAQFAEGYLDKVAPQVLTQTGQYQDPSQVPKPTVDDLVPPPPNDGMGTSLMFMGLPVLLAGFMTAVGLRSNLAKLSGKVAISIMGVMALFYATIPVFIAYAVHGAFTEHALPVYLLLAGMCFTVMLFHTGGMRLIGLYMALPTMFLLVLLGIPSSGAGMAIELVPPIFQGLHRVLPTPALMEALRRILYFPDAPLSASLSTLLLWFFLAVILLAASFLRRPTSKDEDALSSESADGQQSDGVRSGRHIRAGYSSLRFRDFFGSRRTVTEEQMQNRRGLVHAFKLPIIVAIALPLMYIGVVHSPSPNHMKIDVVASDTSSHKLVQALDDLPKDDYEVRSVKSADDARQDVLENKARAAYVPASSAAGISERTSDSSAVLFVATGNGMQSESAAEKLVGTLTQGAPLQKVDLAPTPQNDKFGMSLMYLGMGGVVGSNLAGMMIGLVGRAWHWGRRIVWVVGVAAANTLLQYLISVHVVHFLEPGAPWTVWGILFLTSLTIQFFTLGGALFLRGSVMTISLPLFVMCGVPSSGLLLPLDMAPQLYTVLNHLVPSSAAIGAMRLQVYLPEASIRGDLILEFVWLAIGILLYTAGHLWVQHLKKKNAAQEQAEAEQYEGQDAGEFEGNALTGSDSPETRQLRVINAKRKQRA
ncbi:ABC transporter permease [uncultured Kocuria sp.]|uniref:ABC transporter permease n=1 Tax=uncultured Kocuria sp. TaxID=259305 RepID=UPI00259ABE3B|nr:ABC transporter permease [uncultured Kocuria sp.]MCT1368422.1 ABC transporter permease [Rothia sp. p3-SID1597]